MKALPTESPRSNFSKKSWAIPLLILGVTALLATLVILQDLEEASRLEKAIQAENSLRMQNLREHLVDYFDSVYSTLLFVSLDNDVVAMRPDSRDYIQKMYDHQWESHRLTEIYVIRRDFQADGKPFMSFERGSEHGSIEEIHSLDREQEEYRVQIEHIRRFEENPNLEALLSNDIRLCTADEQGKPELGRVFSVPIRSKDGLVGIVAGMIQDEAILRILRNAGDHRTDLLVNDRGEIKVAEPADPAILDWFKKHFAVAGVTAFFESTPETIELGEQTVLWSPVRIVPAEKWWLIHLYSGADEIHATRFSGLFGHLLMATCIMLAGASMAMLVRVLGRRIEENRLHLSERKRMEWQVQEESERVQRRIGGSLREDLCQRLSGIAAYSTALTRKLESSDVPEARLASEITLEINESLTNAMHLADELQPVSLLEHGLLAALKELAAHTAERTGISCRVEAGVLDTEPKNSIATQLLRIVQEAVLNVVQHSQATALQIQLSMTGDNLEVRVSDDGIGNAQAISLTPGLGLRIMRYRSDLIGGHLEILPAPTRGIVVRCSCPTTNHTGVGPTIEKSR